MVCCDVASTNNMQGANAFSVQTEVLGEGLGNRKFEIFAIIEVRDCKSVSLNIARGKALAM